MNRSTPIYAQLPVEPVVSIQGQPGSFHHIGARKLFGDVRFLYRDSFREVFNDARTGRSNFQFIAIENSIAGSIIYNYDHLAKARIPIVAELYLRIGQHLIARPGTTLKDVSEVWSHPMAIEQCRHFLDTLEVSILEKSDTAGSVKELLDSGRSDVAVISSDYSAELYGMEIIKPHIETDPNNYTRFLLLSYEQLPAPEGAKEGVSGREASGADAALNISDGLEADGGKGRGASGAGDKGVDVAGTREASGKRLNIKSTLWFGVSHRPGGLVEVLKVFQKYAVNMTKLESRPRVGSPWVYDFFADMELDVNSVTGELVLAEARAQCEFLEVLGTYPDLTSLSSINFML